VDRAGPKSRGSFPPGSVYDEGPEGLSMARRWVAEHARRTGAEGSVSVFTGRIGLDPLPPNGIILRMQPIHGPMLPSKEEVEELPTEGAKGEPKDEAQDEDKQRAREEARRSAAQARERERRRHSRLLTEDEEAFVRGGGRIVLGLSSEYGPVETKRRGAGEQVRKVFPIWPGVLDLAPENGGRGLEGVPLREARTLFARGNATVLALLEVGKGDVVLLAIPEVLANASLGKAHHAALLGVLVGSGRPVYFDERAHGLGVDDNLFTLLVAYGLGPSLLLVALGLLLALWRGRVRLGEPEAEAKDRRSEAVDLVDSLGELYDRALSRRDAVRLHLLGLRRAVALRSGLRGRALDERMIGLVGEPLEDLDGKGEIAPAVFQRALAAVNDGYRRLEEHAVSR